MSSITTNCVHKCTGSLAGVPDVATPVKLLATTSTVVFLLCGPMGTALVHCNQNCVILAMSLRIRVNKKIGIERQLSQDLYYYYYQ